MKIKFMKRVVLLFVLGFLITACSEDDGLQITAKDIVGTWSCTSIDFTGATTTKLQGLPVTVNLDGVGYDIDFNLTLSEDPNIASSEGKYSIELTTSVLGQNVVENIENLAFNVDGTWSKEEGSELSISKDGITTNVTIVNLTRAVLEFNMNTEETISQNGTTANVTVETNVRFVRN